MSVIHHVQRHHWQPLPPCHGTGPEFNQNLISPSQDAAGESLVKFKVLQRTCLLFVVTQSQSFFVPMSLYCVWVRLHVSSLHSSDNADKINSLLSTGTSSSKKAKPIRISLRDHKWRRKVFRHAMATASLFVWHWTSCCNDFKPCCGTKSAGG